MSVGGFSSSGSTPHLINSPDCGKNLGSAEETGNLLTRVGLVCKIASSRQHSQNLINMRLCFLARGASSQAEPMSQSWQTIQPGFQS